MAKKSGIHIKKSKKGSLHTALGVKKGEKIPASKLKIKSTDSPALKKKKQFAINAKKFKHQAGGEIHDLYDPMDDALYDHFVKMSISQAQNGGDEAGQMIGQYNQQNPMDFSGAPGGNFQPSLTPGASAQQNGLISPQQQFNTTRVGTNPSVDLKQYLKTPQGAANYRKYKSMGYDITGFGPDGKPQFSKTNKVVTGPNQGVQLFNSAASLATGIADTFQEKQHRADEYRQVVKNIAPRFMENMESEGLNNMPAYTMYGGQRKMGGPIAHGEPVGVVDFSPGSGLDESMYEGFRHNVPYGQNMIYSGELGRYQVGGKAVPKFVIPQSEIDRKHLTPEEIKQMQDNEGFITPQFEGQAPLDSVIHHIRPKPVPTSEILAQQAAFLKAHPELHVRQNGGTYRAGGQVSAAKAKEILKDGTAQGHPLTDKQKRYFGWLAGGGKQYGGNMTSFQAGGATPPGPNPNPVNPPADNSDPNEDYYKANATLQYFKTQLNNKLREKDPKAYDKFQSGFADINNQYKSGKLPATQLIPTRQNYVQNSDYNIALSPEDVQGALGDQYQTYLNSLQTVNKYNVAKGQQPLYGTVEGDQDITKLNYGRRFASVTTNPTSDSTLKKANGTIQRRRTSYAYDPNSKQVNASQVELDENGNPIIPNGGSRQAGGYAVGQTVNLTTSQIRELKKQGYKIENV